MRSSPRQAGRIKKAAGWAAAVLFLGALTLPYWAPPSVRPALGPFSSPEQARTFIASQGAWAWATYLGLWLVQAVAAPLPAFALTLAGAALFGFWIALPLTTAGAMLGAAVTFGIGRRLRHAVHREEPRQNARLVRLEQFVMERGAYGVFALRLLPLFPFDPVSYLAGFGRIAWGPFLLATLAGMMPSTLALTLIGSGTIPARHKWFVLLAVSAVLVVAAFLARSRLFKPRGPDAAAPPE